MYCFMCFPFIFSERITTTSSGEVLKLWADSSFQEIQTKSSVTLISPVQLQFI